jgi:TniQ
VTVSDSHRTLPIRVPPLPGEALDSWLDALAWRLATPIAQLRQVLGLTSDRSRGVRPSVDAKTLSWAVLLSDAEANQVAAVTGIPLAAVHAMTLRRYDGRLLFLDHARRAVRQQYLWGRRAGSWCCPACLADSGGRWPLAWRLVWRFACSRHNLLLVDRCPGCRRVPRARSVRLSMVVEPGRCSLPGPDATRRSGGAARPCGQDFRVADAVAIPADSPVLAAQRVLDQLIDRPEAPVTYLGAERGDARAFLDDLKLLATRILRIADDGDLAPYVPVEFMARRYEVASGARSSAPEARRSRNLLAPVSSAVVAATVTAAFDVLDAPDMHVAARRIGWLMRRHHDVGVVTVPTGIKHNWGRYASEGLQAVLLSAMDGYLVPADRLRYRTFGPRPRLPTVASRAVAAQRSRWIPSVLWSRWALLLTPVRWADPTVYRAVASCMLAMIGGIDSQAAVARRLGGVTKGHAVSSMQRRLTDRGILERVARTLEALASRLDDEGAPIDYERRRATFTQFARSPLISLSEWRTIHATWGGGGEPGGVARLRRVQYYLFELLTGCPPHVGLGTATASIDAYGYRTFRQQLTIPVDQALQQHARALLAAHGINEPLTWQPPLEWAPEAEWLAPDPESLDPHQIRQALHAEHAAASSVARRLGVSIGHIRYVTDRHPIDSSSSSWAFSPAAVRKRRNLAALPPAYLRQRYEADGWTYAQIAAETRVSREAVRAYAHRAAIRPRPPGRRSQVHLDLDWFAREYVENQRTLKELAVEAGTSPTTIARIAKAAGIPIRPRGWHDPGGHRSKVNSDI